MVTEARNGWKVDKEGGEMNGRAATYKAKKEKKKMLSGAGDALSLPMREEKANAERGETQKLSSLRQRPCRSGHILPAHIKRKT